MEILPQQMDNSSVDGNIPKLEVEIMADGNDEGEDEFLSHSTVTWDQPRRFANHQHHYEENSFSFSIIPLFSPPS